MRISEGRNQMITFRKSLALFLAALLLIQAWIPAKSHASGNGGNYYITTVAGTGNISKSGENIPATTADLYYPADVATDSMGNLYIAESSYHRIRKVDAATGLISTVAGTGTAGSSVVDGTRLATATNLDNPSGIAVDSKNNLYIADFNNRRVLKVGSDQKVSRVWYGNFVTAIALDSADRLYIIEQQKIGSTFNYDYRVLRTDGVTDTATNNACLVAGTTTTHTACVANSAATQEALAFSNALVLDSANNLYIADTGNHRILKVAADGSFTTVAGIKGVTGSDGDGGVASAAHLNSPTGVALDSAGNLYISDRDNSKVRKVDASTGEISTIVGTGSRGFAGDNGSASSAQIKDALGIAIHTNGTLYIADYSNMRIRSVKQGFMIGYDANGGSGSVPASKVYSLYENVTVSDNTGSLTKTGYTFKGWNTLATGLGTDYSVDSTFAASGDVKLFAKWEKNQYTLTYTAGANGTIGGQPSVTQSVYHGENGTAVTAVPNSGYRFVKWSDDITSAVRADTNITAVLGVTASFEPDSYTVSFEANGGSPVPSNQSVVNNANANVPTEPTLTGHTFGGWYSDQTLNTPFVFASTPITKNTVLYAKWIPIPYTLTYTAGTKGTISGASPQTVNHGSNGTPVTAVPNTGYAFVKWSDDNTNATRTDANVTGPINVSAIFEANVYVVSFESNGGDGVSSQNVPYNGYAIAPQPPTLSGCAFEGWYTDTGLNNRFDFAAMPITGNITLYAKWAMLPPGAPALQSAIPGDGTVTIQWASVEGADDYQVFMSSTSGNYDPQSAISVTNSVYSYQATGLTNGITYYFIVKAVNAGGAIASNEASATPRTFPSAPANVTATAGNSSATISFTAPTNNGGSPITEYRVTALPGNIEVTGTLTQITVSGLTNGTKYTFTVDARNAAGYGPQSAVSNEITPKAPTNTGNGGGGGGGAPNTTNTSDGKLTIPTGSGGQTKLGDEITVTVPAGASDKELKLTVDKVTDNTGLNPNGQDLASPVFDMKGNAEDGFKKPIELVLKFDPSLVKDGQRASIHLFDEKTKSWLEIGGKVSGNTITAEVTKTGSYAVLIVGKEPIVVEPTVTFSDIAGHWAEVSIRQAVKQGIVKGYANGTFKPNVTVTRAEFAVMLMNALKPDGNGTELSFTDNDRIGAWAQAAIAQAVQASIIKGFTDGTFRPNAELTRAEMASIVSNALKLRGNAEATNDFADATKLPNWAKGAIGALTEAGIMQGKNGNHFDAAATATRAEAVTVLLKMLAQASK